MPASLPPQVSGKIYGSLRLSVEAVTWLLPDPPASTQVRVKWWGEENYGQLLRPASCVGTGPALSSTVYYTVRCSAQRLFSYLDDARELEMELVDEGSHRVFATATMDLTMRRSNSSRGGGVSIAEGALPIYSRSGARLGDLIVSAGALFKAEPQRTSFEYNELIAETDPTLSLYPGKDNSSWKEGLGWGGPTPATWAAMVGDVSIPSTVQEEKSSHLTSGNLSTSQLETSWREAERRHGKENRSANASGMSGRNEASLGISRISANHSHASGHSNSNSLHLSLNNSNMNSSNNTSRADESIHSTPPRPASRTPPRARDTSRSRSHGVADLLSFAASEADAEGLSRLADMIDEEQPATPPKRHVPSRINGPHGSGTRSSAAAEEDRVATQDTATAGESFTHPGADISAESRAAPSNRLDELLQRGRELIAKMDKAGGLAPSSTPAAIVDDDFSGKGSTPSEGEEEASMLHSADGDDVVIVSPSLSVSILGDASLVSPREEAAQERDQGRHCAPSCSPQDDPQAPVPRQPQSAGHRAEAAADVTPPRGVTTADSLSNGSKPAPFAHASLMPPADKQVAVRALNLEHSEGGMLHVVVSSVALGGGSGGLGRGGSGKLLIDCVVPCPARSDTPEALGESGHGQVCVRVPGEGELGAQDLAEGRALQVDGTMRFPMNGVQSSCLMSGDAVWPRGSEIQIRVTRETPPPSFGKNAGGDVRLAVVGVAHLDWGQIMSGLGQRWSGYLALSSVASEESSVAGHVHVTATLTCAPAAPPPALATPPAAVESAAIAGSKESDVRALFIEKVDIVESTTETTDAKPEVTLVCRSAIHGLRVCARGGIAASTPEPKAVRAGNAKNDGAALIIEVWSGAPRKRLVGLAKVEGGGGREIEGEGVGLVTVCEGCFDVRSPITGDVAGRVECVLYRGGAPAVEGAVARFQAADAVRMDAKRRLDRLRRARKAGVDSGNVEEEEEGGEGLNNDDECFLSGDEDDDATLIDSESSLEITPLRGYAAKRRRAKAQCAARPPPSIPCLFVRLGGACGLREGASRLASAHPRERLIEIDGPNAYVIYRIVGAGGGTQAGGWRTSATVCGDFTPSFEHVDTIDLEEVHLDLEESHLDVEVWHRSGQVSGAGGRQSAEFVAGEGRGSRGGLVGACDLLIGATRIPITANECNVGGWRVLKAPNEMPSGAVQVHAVVGQRTIDAIERRKDDADGAVDNRITVSTADTGCSGIASDKCARAVFAGGPEKGAEAEAGMTKVPRSVIESRHGAQSNAAPHPAPSPTPLAPSTSFPWGASKGGELVVHLQSVSIDRVSEVESALSNAPDTRRRIVLRYSLSSTCRPGQQHLLPALDKACSRVFPGLQQEGSGPIQVSVEHSSRTGVGSGWGGGVLTVACWVESVEDEEVCCPLGVCDLPLGKSWGAFSGGGMGWVGGSFQLVEPSCGSLLGRITVRVGLRDVWGTGGMKCGWGDERVECGREEARAREMRDVVEEESGEKEEEEEGAGGGGGVETTDGVLCRIYVERITGLDEANREEGCEQDGEEEEIREEEEEVYVVCDVPRGGGGIHRIVTSGGKCVRGAGGGKKASLGHEEECVVNAFGTDGKLTFQVWKRRCGDADGEGMRIGDARVDLYSISRGGVVDGWYMIDGGGVIKLSVSSLDSHGVAGLSQGWGGVNDGGAGLVGTWDEDCPMYDLASLGQVASLGELACLGASKDSLLGVCDATGVGGELSNIGSGGGVDDEEEGWGRPEWEEGGGKDIKGVLAACLGELDVLTSRLTRRNDEDDRDVGQEELSNDLDASCGEGPLRVDGAGRGMGLVVDVAYWDGPSSDSHRELNTAVLPSPPGMAFDNAGCVQGADAFFQERVSDEGVHHEGTYLDGREELVEAVGDREGNDEDDLLAWVSRTNGSLLSNVARASAASDDCCQERSTGERGCIADAASAAVSMLSGLLDDSVFTKSSTAGADATADNSIIALGSAAADDSMLLSDGRASVANPTEEGDDAAADAEDVEEGCVASDGLYPRDYDDTAEVAEVSQSEFSEEGGSGNHSFEDDRCQVALEGDEPSPKGDEYGASARIASPGDGEAILSRPSPRENIGPPGSHSTMTPGPSASHDHKITTPQDLVKFGWGVVPDSAASKACTEQGTPVGVVDDVSDFSGVRAKEVESVSVGDSREKPRRARRVRDGTEDKTRRLARILKLDV